ncbi:ammonia-forming cytochrome c nitrite reductase subunit c552 [Candidatus Sumerlaeota bacterium]|nr:ammonia-forming cytochrome c nitrite reductase subunit c552 [Candidatus Sumerlaeota bacterium]
MLAAMLVAVSVAALVVTTVLVTMFEHKQDARTPYLRMVELDETSAEPARWGLNWPRQFGQYKSTAGDKFYGGSNAMPASKLESHPWLKRLYAGYAFSIDYREARGHAYMLYDQVVTERVNKRSQAGACLHCHASATVLYRKVGLEAMGQPSDDKALAADFNMPAVIKGFEELSAKPYHEVLALLTQMPDGTPPEKSNETFPSPPLGGFSGENIPEGHFAMSEAHPVSCIDCHDPATMALRVTRPGFMQGIARLASSEAPVPHLPSVEKWRRGDRSEPYDPNKLATRQELRSFACGQCHVEYYCANKDVLTFPWGNGLKIEQIEEFWENRKFPDGGKFYDYVHGETGAPVFKAQHPEFELWSQGIHARAGVSCADCHMPYEREGAMKLSNHNVRSPMENVNNACQVCHNVSEDDLRQRVKIIQQRTTDLTERAGGAMTEMVDAIKEAKAAGATEEQLKPIFDLQRKAMWRLDFISSENSRGFHADQEAARILAESIDYSRKAEAEALRLRAPQAPDTSSLPSVPPTGVTEKR